MISKAIADYMKENGIEQSFLCEKTGLSEHCVSFALSGKQNFSIEEYEKICAAFNVPYRFFFERRTAV